MSSPAYQPANVVTVEKDNPSEFWRAGFLLFIIIFSALLFLLIALGLFALKKKAMPKKNESNAKKAEGASNKQGKQDSKNDKLGRKNAKAAAK